MKKIILLLYPLLTFVTTSFGQSQLFERYKILKDTTYLVEKLGYNKHLQITVPKEYQAGISQQFALIIIFDMQNQNNYNYMVKTIDYMTATGQMPASVVIGIEAGKNANRILETLLDPGNPKALGTKNEEYIFNDLIPMARQQFKASNFTLLIGHSRYGYFTSYLLAKHIKELNGVISLSPFLGQTDVNSREGYDLLKPLINEVNTTQLPHNVYYRFAMGDDSPKDYKRLDDAIKAGDFKNLNFNVRGWILPDATHIAVPGLIISRALYDVFTYWLSAQNKYLYSKALTVDSIKHYNEQVEAHYGTQINFSLGVLNGTGWGYYNNNDYSTAILAWEQLVKYYPNFSEGYLNIAKCKKKLNLPTDETMKQFKNSLTQSVFLTGAQKEALLKDAENL